MAPRRRSPSSLPPRHGEAPSVPLIDGLTTLAGLVGQALETGTAQMSRTLHLPLAGALPGLGKREAALDAGLRLRTVEDMTAALRRRADRPASADAADDAPTGARLREPLVDVFDEELEMVVAAEVPGCGPEDIDIVLDDDRTGLTVTAGGTRGFERHIALPARADPTRLESGCKNGMLEVRLAKREYTGDSSESVRGN